MTRIFLLLVLVAAAPGLALATAPNGTAPTAAETTAAPSSASTPAVTQTAGDARGTAPTATATGAAPPSTATASQTPAPDGTAPTATATAEAPTEASPSAASNETIEATLDEHAAITDYRLNDGVLIVDVQLDKPTTISATERAKTEGASNVRFEQWVHLDEGRHTLRIDTFDNESATVLMYSDRGLEADGRAVQLSVDNSPPLLRGPFSGGDLLVVGLSIAVCFTFFVTWEAAKARLGLGQGGERIA